MSRYHECGYVVIETSFSSQPHIRTERLSVVSRDTHKKTRQNIVARRVRLVPWGNLHWQKNGDAPGPRERLLFFISFVQHYTVSFYFLTIFHSFHSHFVSLISCLFFLISIFSVKITAFAKKFPFNQVNKEFHFKKRIQSKINAR